MIEIRNTGNVTVTLGTSDKRASIALSDRWFLPDPLPPPQGQPIGPIPVWTFRSGVTIPAGGSIIVFCDGNSCQDTCEPHADFQVDSDGSEPITLWGPEVGGTRPIIDQVWLPPLRSDVSFSRLDPSPSSRAPVPIQETFEHFGFTPGSSASFGSCFNVGGVGTCALGCGDYQKRFCRGKIKYC